MNPLPKLVILDRDGLINANSRDPESPFYRITHPHLLVFKPNVKTAIELLIAAEIPFVFATKQRGLKDGSITEDAFMKMWVRMNHELIPARFKNMEFPPPYVEMVNPDKADQFRTILGANPHLKPEEITVIDDSITECAAAARLGMNPIQTGDLYGAVCEILGVSP